VSGIVDIVLPVFGMVAIGYGVGRTPLLTPEGIRGLTNFVFFVAIPALLFRSMSTLELPETVEVAVIPAYFGTALAVMALGMLVGRAAFGLTLDAAAVFGMGGTFSNTVLLGLPIVLLAFGEQGLLALLFILAFHPLVMLTVPTVVVEVARGEGVRAREVAVSATAALLKNPIIIGMLAGLGFGTTGWGLPGAIETLIDMLKAAATPAALFALGASLTQYRIAGSLPESMTMVAIKLVVFPAAMFAVCRFVFDLGPLWTAVATLNAAMPTGVNVFLLASTYQVMVARAATAVLISTALAVVSASVLIGWLGPAAG